MDVLRRFLVLEMRHGASLPWSTMARALRGFLQDTVSSNPSAVGLDAQWIKDMNSFDAYKSTFGSEGIIGMDYITDIHEPDLVFRMLHDAFDINRFKQALKRFAENRGWTLTFTDRDNE